MPGTDTEAQVRPLLQEAAWASEPLMEAPQPFFHSFQAAFQAQETETSRGHRWRWPGAGLPLTGA